MTKDIKDKIHLIEKDIVSWEKPLREGYMETGAGYNGKTELIRSLGMDVVSETISDYIVYATAVKYNSTIIRLGEERLLYGPSDKIEGTPENLILFSGNIAIYFAEQAVDANLKAFDLESAGRIWIAKNPTEALESHHGLYHLIFGNEITEEGKIKRIQDILNGHEQLREERESAQANRESESWEDGLNQGKSGFHDSTGLRRK